MRTHEPYIRQSQVAFRRVRSSVATATNGQVKALGKELSLKEQALAEARALVSLSKQAKGLDLGGRGRLHGPEVRRQVCRLVDQAMADGARLASTCRLLGISVRTVQRWRKPALAEDRRLAARRRPANRLTDQERGWVLELMQSPVFAGLTPRQIVPKLADQGIYVASESTMYRLLRSQQRAHRPQQAHARHRSGDERRVSAPNQIWSWDITCLHGPARGTSLYLYMMMDVFSRRIMGWRIHREERAEHAARFVRSVCADNHIAASGLVLHSDNGRPMKGTMMLHTLRQLGIVPSFGRPRVSNDNPHVEALFSFLKRHKDYPSHAFASLKTARAWVARFVDWYNGEHLHSSLCFVSPDDKYFGRDTSVLARRRSVYNLARIQVPGRWTGGPRNWSCPPPPRVRIWPHTASFPVQSESKIALSSSPAARHPTREGRLSELEAGNKAIAG
ncbi:IS3 family transposase [Cystobacter fuscus]|uniref:IS3 family transposase n=1 Tax=Cystobacter fuscus TaxID=43 RepID=UPI0037C1B04C